MSYCLEIVWFVGEKHEAQNCSWEDGEIECTTKELGSSDDIGCMWLSMCHSNHLVQDFKVFLWVTSENKFMSLYSV